MRNAKPEDTKKIINLLKESFSHAWKKTKRKFNRKFVEEKIKKATRDDITFLEERDGRIIAFGWAKHGRDFFGNRFGEITLLIVSPDYQNQKVGTKIMKTLERRLKEKDIRLDCLCINPAMKCYKKQGFKEFITTLRKK